jgi:hypothetical protein
MKINKTNTTGGISLLTLIGIIFVIFKLFNVIAWSWWWVLLPFYFPFILCFFIAMAMLLFIKN